MGKLTILPIYGNELGMEQSYVYHHLCDLVQLKGAVRSFFYICIQKLCDIVINICVCFRFPCSHNVSIEQTTTFGCLNPPS